MKKYFIFILLLALISLKAFPQRDTLLIEPVKCQEGAWKLIFQDEFNNGALETHKWFTYFPYTTTGKDTCVFCRTHGNEGQILLDENVVVSDTTLKLIAKREKATWMGEERDHTTGMIHSKQKFGPARYEVRAKLPPGLGFWPAIWVFGKIYTEIDIMEAGMQHPKRYHTSIHNWEMGKMAHNRNKVKTDLSTDFHVYVMEWDPDIIRFFIDDKEVWSLSRYTTRRGRNLKRCDLKPGRYAVNPIFPNENEKVNLIVSLGVGTSNTPFTKSPDTQTIFPNQMVVDWVRVYERE